MTTTTSCQGDCARVITYHPDSRYMKRRPLAEGDSLTVVRFVGEPTYFTRPGSCVVIAQLHRHDDPIAGDGCWDQTTTVGVVSVNPEAGEASVVPG